jgi:hypothetical protein
LASNQPDIQQRLRDGIEAARRGDRVNARRLLQQVLIIDRDNEVALMWMASMVDTLAERRAFLERALKVNPQNARAREALQKMGVNLVDAPTGGAAPMPRANDERRAANNGNLYIIAAFAVALVTAIIVIGSVLNSRQVVLPTVSDPQQAAEATFQALIQPTQQPTLDTRPPTETPFIGVVVTLDPNRQVLPATFTPTDTPEPTATFTPTATFVPFEAYNLVFSAFRDDEPQAGLFRASADASSERLIGSPLDGYGEVAVSPDGRQVAFVRNTRTEDSPPDVPALPQLFIAPINRPDDAVIVTNFGGTTLTHPSFSPDGRLIVFVTNQDGDDDIWLVEVDGSNPRPLTVNDANDTSPSFSPDGTRILYASDELTPGFSEIYELNLETNDTIRLTDEAGDNYAPAYAPDGSRIIFISTQGGDGDIYIMDANGQRKFLLTLDDNGAEDSAPVFTPDGEYIAFMSNRGDDPRAFGVYMLHVRTGQIEQIFDGSAGVQSFAFIPQVR